MALFQCNMWAGLRLIMPEHLRGVGIGIANGVQNVSYSVAALIIGGILDRTEDKQEGYRYVNFYLGSSIAVATIIMIIWNIKDKDQLSTKKAQFDDTN